MDVVQPGRYIALRLPSDLHKVVEVQPKTIISLGKYGSVPASLIIGRPFHHTYELLEPDTAGAKPRLRIVPPAELYKHIHDEDAEEDATPEPEEPEGADFVPVANGQPEGAPPAIRTGFALAKYNTMRARKKEKRFTLLPLDVPLLAHWFLYEREGTKTFEMREEVLAIAMSWANVHCGGFTSHALAAAQQTGDSNQWLVVDETGGLIVAAMAERMGILYPEADAEADAAAAAPASTDHESVDAAAHNTITLVHTNAQPNLSLLSFFGFDVNNPSPKHPLTKHLHTLSWLQLLDPTADPWCIEPPVLSAAELATAKAGRRSAYYRKRRRWARAMAAVTAARTTLFAGLVVAAAMEPTGVLHATVPRLRGGAQVVVYAACREPLVTLQDYYSSARRAAFREMTLADRAAAVGGPEWPVDPRLLVDTAIHAVRARPWQVLPGRTHPLMMGRGGADGYVFVGTRSMPSVERVMAYGAHPWRKKRRVDEVLGARGSDEEADDVEMEGVHMGNGDRPPTHPADTAMPGDDSELRGGPTATAAAATTDATRDG